MPKYKEITVEEGLQALNDNKGKPVDGFAHPDEGSWSGNHQLTGISVDSPTFWLGISGWQRCARIIPQYGELLDGTPVLEKYPLPEGWELVPEGEKILPNGGDNTTDILKCQDGYGWIVGDYVEYASKLGIYRAQARRISPIAKGHNPDKLTEAQVEIDQGWLANVHCQTCRTRLSGGYFLSELQKPQINVGDGYFLLWDEIVMDSDEVSNLRIAQERGNGWVRPRVSQELPAKEAYSRGIVVRRKKKDRIAKNGEIWKASPTASAHWLVLNDQEGICLTDKKIVTHDIGVFREDRGDILVAESLREYYTKD